MTADEALYHLKKDLPAAIDQVVAEHVGRPETLQAIAPYAAKLRNATSVDEAASLDDDLDKIALSDPPVHDRLVELTAGVRAQADAESIPGQLRQAAKDAGKVVQSSVELIELAVGLYILWKILR